MRSSSVAAREHASALRGVAIGRKNYLFAGSDAGGRRAAAMSSLIETAKLNDINPQLYRFTSPTYSSSSPGTGTWPKPRAPLVKAAFSPSTYRHP